MTRVKCPHCGTESLKRKGAEHWCPQCLHRADRTREQCDCLMCLAETTPNEWDLSPPRDLGEQFVLPEPPALPWSEAPAPAVMEHHASGEDLNYHVTEDGFRLGIRVQKEPDRWFFVTWPKEAVPVLILLLCNGLDDEQKNDLLAELIT